MSTQVDNRTPKDPDFNPGNTKPIYAGYLQ